MTRATPSVLIIGVLMAGSAAAAPIPAGSEFQVNTYTTGSQRDPDVCVDADGDFVVVWDGFEVGVRGRRFDAAGNPLAGEFIVSEWPVSRAHIACRPDGGFVVTWGDGADVFARRYDTSGSPIGLPFMVNDFTTGSQGEPTVAVNASGEFVVVWTDYDGRDGSGYGVFGRRFDGSGAPVGADFQVNTYTTGYQEKPQVDIASTGEFVVVWKNTYRSPPSFYPVTGQRFDATGSPAGSEFVVNSATSDLSRGILDVSLTPGGFVVAWPAYDPDLSQKVIFGRRFDTSGTPVAAEFRVDASDRYPEYASVDSDANGRFVVAWTDYLYGGESNYGAWGRAFDADETPNGDPFLVNTETSGNQGILGPGVAVAPDGNFVIVWDSEDQDGDGDGVFGQRFVLSASCSTTPLPGCRQPTVSLKAKLLLVDDPDPLHDVIRWTWPKGEATDVSAFGDPVASDAYALCLYDESGAPALVFDAAIPAGGTCGTKPCWKGTGEPPGAKGFKYKNKERTPEGVLKLVLKAGLEGKTKVVVKGGGPHLGAGVFGLPPLPLALPARMQLQGPGGACWEAVYSAAGVTMNSATEFGGKAD
jgi:hypothetical protein